MYCVRTVTPDVFLLGASDRRLSLFENVFPVPRGVSYNAYLVLDEKTVLVDTVDSAVGAHFYENLEHALQGRPLDYVIINHMEPDHCSTLGAVFRCYPDAKVVASAKAISMIGQFFDADVTERCMPVKEGDTLCTGRHTFAFAMAPMVHWPEVMVTYDTTDKLLFSADAFGTFGALNGNIFADEVNFQSEWLPDARRYYTNIVGKYGPQVQTLLKKAAALDIQYLCPLHGPIWRKDIGWFVEKYQRWSSYTPEDRTVAIFCGSIYGNTENAAEILAARLADKGVRDVRLYDVSHTHVSELVSEAFRCSHLVFASATYNGEIYTPMDNFLRDLKSHGLRNRTAALIENGTWAAVSGKQMAELLGTMKDITVLEGTVSLKSSVKEAQRQSLEALADTLAADVLAHGE
ncbi:MAG: FprA family A-type flavoprotein [Oscillibacter sp.]|jgi:flavorubredoxin|nr:FprA family A-type flavoprotein [Oscillibacter sp.]